MYSDLPEQRDRNQMGSGSSGIYGKHGRIHNGRFERQKRKVFLHQFYYQRFSGVRLLRT